MAAKLPVVEKLGLACPLEPGKTQGALRIVRHQLPSEQHHGGAQQAPLHAQVQPVQHVHRVGRLGRQSSAMARRAQHAVDLVRIQVD